MILQNFKKINIKNILKDVVRNMDLISLKDKDLKHKSICESLETYNLPFEPVKNNFGYLYYFNCPACGDRRGVLYSPKESKNYKCKKCYGINDRKDSSIINTKYFKSLKRMKKIQELLLSSKVNMEYRLRLEKELEYLESVIPKFIKSLTKNI